MTAPYTPLWTTPAEPGMLSNFHGSNTGTLSPPAAPSPVAQAGSTSLPSGSYTFVATLVSANGGETIAGSSASVTITAGQQISVSLVATGSALATPYTNFYLTAAPGGVNLGFVGQVQNHGTGFTETSYPLLVTSTTQGVPGHTAPLVNTTADVINLSTHYSNPNATDKAGAIQVTAELVQTGGGPTQPVTYWFTGWLGGPCTSSLPVPGLKFGPQAAVTYGGRVYAITSPSQLQISGVAGALLSTPINGASVGTWRYEVPLPTISGAVVNPGSLCVINNRLYALSDEAIWYTSFNGDGSLTGWTLGQLVTGGGLGVTFPGSTMTGWDSVTQGGTASFIVYFRSGGGNTTPYTYVVNTDGTMVAAVAQANLPNVAPYGASVIDAGMGYVYHLGGQNGGASLSTVYYAPISATTGQLTGAWASAVGVLPAGNSEFGFTTTPGTITAGGGTSAVVYIVGGNSNPSGPTAANYNWRTNSNIDFARANTVLAWDVDTVLPVSCMDLCLVLNSGSQSDPTIGNPGGTWKVAVGVGSPGGSGGQQVYAYSVPQGHWFTGAAAALTNSQLGAGSTVTSNQDGSMDVQFRYGMATAGGVQGFLTGVYNNGDAFQISVQFLDQNGDPSPVATTIVYVGQPPSVSSAAPSGGIATGQPSASFLYQPGAGGGPEASWRLQVHDPSNVLVFDTGSRADQTNVVTVNTAPLLLSGTAYTFLWTVTSTDVPIDSNSTNTGTVSTTVTPSYVPPPVPINFAVGTDSTRSAALPSWIGPSSPGLTPAPSQADPAGSSSLLPGTYGVAYTYVTAAGETAASPVGSVTLADLSPPSAPVVAQADPTGAQGLVPGAYGFVQTFTNNAGETIASSTGSVTIADISAPAVAPVVAQANPTGAAGLIAGTYTFVLTYSNTVGETQAGGSASVTIADVTPPSAPTLAQSAGSSVFTASEVVHVRYELANSVGRTTPSADTSITISTNANKVTTTITLPAGATGLRLFVGTSSSALALADIDAAGNVTFLGGKSSGVSVVVSGGLQLTITDTASGTGPAQDGTNTAHSVIQWTPPSLPAGRTFVNLYLTVVPGGGPALGFEVHASTTTPILVTGGGNGTSPPGASTAHRCVSWTPPSLPTGATSVKLYLTSVPGGGPALGFEATATNTTPVAITSGGSGTAAPAASTAHRVISVPSVVLPGGATAIRWYLTSTPGGVTAGFVVQNTGGSITINAGGNGVSPPAPATYNRIYYRRNGTLSWYLLVDLFLDWAFKVEAESGTLASGATVHTDHANYSGSGFVAFAGSSNSDTFSISTPIAGTYTLDIRYANGQGSSRTLDLVVNGGAAQTLTFPATANWDTWGDVTVTVTLAAGANTIELIYNVADSGNFNVDFITVSTGASSDVLMDQLAIGGIYDFAISALDSTGGIESALSTAVTGVTIPNPSNGATVMLHIQGSGPTEYVPLMASGGVKVKGFLDVQASTMFGLSAPAVRYGTSDFREFDVTARLVDTAADPLAATTYALLQTVFAALKTGSTGVLRTVAGTMLTIGLSIITSSSSAALYDIDFLPASYLSMRDLTLSLLQVPNQYQPSTTAGSALGLLPQINGSVKPLNPLEMAL